MQRSHHKAKSGFTLIQLSIILTVASLLMVANLPGIQTSLNANKASVIKMNAIMNALRQYQTANSTLPCPADATLATGSSNYGVAAANSGATNNCIGSVPAANYADTANHIAVGMIPVRTLGLSSDYALDGYGRDITYLVDTTATATCWANSALQGAITVTDNGVTQNTIVALVSHGTDGYGAWLPLQGTSGTASRLDSGSTDASQADNAQIAHGGGLTANTTFASFVKQGATSTFDDNVVYRNQQYNLNQLPLTYSSTTSYINNCTNNAPYYRTITLDHTKVPNTDQTNFPVLFSGTYSYLATLANGGKVTNSNGYDLTFTSDAAGTQLLPFEQENYNAATGQVSYWVNIPTLSHTADTIIYLRYDNSSITTDQSNKNGVWDSNYKAVYHFNNSLNDSTSNAGALTNGGSTSVAGQIANGQNFVRANSQYAYSTTVPMTAIDNFTMSLWVYMNSISAANYVFVTNGYDNGPTAGSGYALEYKQSKFKVLFPGYVGGSPYRNDILTNPSANTWYHLAISRSGGTFQAYVNATPQGGTFNITPLTPSTNFSIGAISASSAPPSMRFSDAIIDEVRLSNTARSADWITTEYNNQISPGSFYTIGSEVGTR